MFYKSVLRILRMDTNPYFKPTEVSNFLVSKREKNFKFFGSSLQYFMVPYSAQFMKRLGIQTTFGKSLKNI